MFSLYAYEKNEKDREYLDTKLNQIEGFKNGKFQRRRTEMALKYRERIADFIRNMSKDQQYKVKDEFINTVKSKAANSVMSKHSFNMRSTFR